jgi:hypothetical protein
MKSGYRHFADSLRLGTRRLITAVLLLSIAVIIPAIGMPQYVSGPLVNALVIIGAETLGVGAAISLGMAPSFVAWGSGRLPAPLVVMIPFIVIGNALLVLGFRALRA